MIVPHIFILHNVSAKKFSLGHSAQCLSIFGTSFFPPRQQRNAFSNNSARSIRVHTHEEGQESKEKKLARQRLRLNKSVSSIWALFSYPYTDNG